MLSKIWLTAEISLKKRQMEKANVVKNFVWSTVAVLIVTF